jgi:hypothetical protein
MKRTVSSSQTYFLKVIQPILAVPVWAGGAYMMFADSHNDAVWLKLRWLFLAVWTFGLASILWLGRRLKAVSVDEHNLYISNLSEEISVPLSDVLEVTESFWINSHPVTIHLKSPSAFGSKIIFQPKWAFRLFGPHPVVKELIDLAAANRGQSRSAP